MTEKSQRPTVPQSIKSSRLERVADVILRSVNRIPEPQMDWEEIRAVKIEFCHHCLLFNHLNCGCNLKFVPKRGCESYRFDGTMNGFEKSRIRPLGKTKAMCKY